MTAAMAVEPVEDAEGETFSAMEGYFFGFIAR